jgi:hypothetical protein
MYKLKDLFDFEDENNNNNNKSDKNKKVDSQLERMKQLNETFQKRGEFIKEETDKKVDEKKLNEESERLKKLSGHRLINEYGNDGFALQGMNQAAHGNTVTTFIPTMGTQSAASYIKPEEALDIAVKRAIESGAPINNMGFYDEVNWHLNKLGFDSKQPIDIKNVLIKIVGRDNGATAE